MSSGVQSKGEKAVICAWVAGRCNIDNLSWCAAHDSPVCGVERHWGAAQTGLECSCVCKAGCAQRVATVPRVPSVWDPVEVERLDARAHQCEGREKRKRVSGVCGIPVREKNTAMLGRNPVCGQKRVQDFKYGYPVRAGSGGREQNATSGGPVCGQKTHTEFRAVSRMHGRRKRAVRKNWWSIATVSEFLRR